MKKYLFNITALLALGNLSAQVRTVNSATNVSVTNSPAFIDASSNTTVNGSSNIGKGLIFPRVDLSAMTAFPGVTAGIPNSFPTRFDGMIVYNTAASGTAGVGSTQGTLSPGYWYYENKTSSNTGGTWKPVSTAAAGVANTASNGLSLSGNDVKLGGTLNQPTTINSSNTNPLNITGGAMRLLNGGVLNAVSGNEQLDMGYAGTSTYMHAVRSRHNAGAAAGNAIDFYTWKFGTDAIGDPGTQQVMTLDGTGNVGIGTNAPTAKLEIDSGTNNLSGLKFSKLTSATPVSAGATLGVDNSGNIVTVNGSSFSPAFGRKVLGANVSVTVPANTANYNLYNFTLPTAGTYLITYSTRGQTQASGGYAGLTTFLSTSPSAGNVIPNTEILIYVSSDPSRTEAGGTGTGTLITTVNAPTTYYVGVNNYGSVSSVIADDTNGRTNVSYVKITP